MSNRIKPLFIGFLYAILILYFFVTIFPILYAFLASFKTNMEILNPDMNFFPKKFSFENYIQAWGVANFSRYTWNSVYMTVIVVIGTIILTTMAGYVFSRGEFPGKKFVFGLFVSTMFISIGTMAYYPLLRIASFLGIEKTLWGVIIIKTVGINMADTYLVRGYLNTIPREIDEAATIDGCNFFKIYLYVLFPLLKPMIATIALLTFMSCWNEYLLSMIFTISNLNQAPLTVGIVALRNSGSVASQWNLMLAGTMISIVPLLLTYIFLNKQFISGLTSGAVKG